MTCTVYHPHWNAIECTKCGDLAELSRATGTDPQKLMEVREGYEQRHAKLHKDQVGSPKGTGKIQTEGQFRREIAAREQAERVLGI